MFPEARQASALVYHQVSRVLWLVPQRVHCHVWVVRHLCNYQQGGAAGESTWPSLAGPHLHYHPLGLELRLLRRSGALVVRSHQPHRCRRLGPWMMYRRAADGWYASPCVGEDRLPRRR